MGNILLCLFVLFCGNFGQANLSVGINSNLLKVVVKWGKPAAFSKDAYKYRLVLIFAFNY